MLRRLVHLASIVEVRIGWNRLALAVSVLLLVGSLAALWTVLRDVGINNVLISIGSTAPRTLLAASLFVAIGYCSLTFYDYFALRVLGRAEVPYATAALAGFASYAIGHGVGAGLLTGNAVRLRIYSWWGLTVADVARIAFLSGLTFWLGNLCALGIVLLVAAGDASELVHLPEIASRTAGLVSLAVVAAYLAWLLPQPRRIGWAPWALTLPSAGLTLVQIGIGLLDLAAGSAALFVLLPSAPSSDFVTIFLVYVLAALVSFLVHAPGSAGAFEATAIVLLPQYDKEALLASLIILQFLYLVLPLAISTIVLGIRERMIEQ